MKRAKMGKKIEMYELGILYQLGRGLPQDMLKAAEWISASADLGYVPAIRWMQDYCFDDGADLQAYS